MKQKRCSAAKKTKKVTEDEGLKEVSAFFQTSQERYGHNYGSNRCKNQKSFFGRTDEGDRFRNF